ncbi:MAG: hypothetical protein Q8Q09_22835 [Deltaproteobacteria bacterium]|nr:hypothetical protein [Deltaproteobacteria bacterium]
MLKRDVLGLVGMGLVLCSAIVSAQDLATVAQQRLLNGLAHDDARRFDEARELARIESQVGRLRIVLVTPPEQVSVQIAQRVIPVPVLALPIAMYPGQHTVVVGSPGMPSQSQTVTIVAANTA